MKNPIGIIKYLTMVRSSIQAAIFKYVVHFCLANNLNISFIVDRPVVVKEPIFQLYLFHVTEINIKEKASLSRVVI